MDKLMVDVSKTRAEQIADKLRHAIMTGTFMSGARLTEITLAHNLNVSQNTIRESLHILEDEGWVTKIPRQGVYVRSFTADEIEELCALRAAIESLTLGWVMRHVTRTQLKELQQQVAKAASYLAADDSEATLETLSDIHRQLAELCGRARTLTVLRRLHNQFRLLETVRQMHAPLNLATVHERVRRYQDLLDVIARGNVAAAQAALHDLIVADCETFRPIANK